MRTKIILVKYETTLTREVYYKIITYLFKEDRVLLYIDVVKSELTIRKKLTEKMRNELDNKPIVFSDPQEGVKDYEKTVANKNRLGGVWIKVI